MTALDWDNTVAPTRIISDAIYSPDDEVGSKAARDKNDFVTPTPHQRQFKDHLRPKTPSGLMKHKDKKICLCKDSNMENIPILDLASFNTQCVKRQNPFRMGVQPRLRRRSITDDYNFSGETFTYLE